MIPTINHFVGQDALIARFRVALEASWQDGKRLPHMLLVGPGGTGKTELAHLAAREMAVGVQERIAQTLSSTGLVNALLLSAEDKEIVFIDEIHELPPMCQTTLYRAMEDGIVFIQGHSTTMRMPLKNITIIAATTDEYSLLPPLRDRFKLTLSFSYYDESSLAKIAGQRAAMMQIPISEHVTREIAKRAKGTPRIVVRLLEAAHRFARSRGDSVVTPQHFEQTLDLEGLDTLGLGSDEQRYLRYLSDHTEPVRLTTLESALGIHRRTIQAVIEPFLLRSGLLERSDKGRLITFEGMRHLGLASGDDLVMNGGEQHDAH